MIRVLVVDDSAVVRSVLSEQLSQCSGITVVGTAIDPYAARDRIAELKPDVITLDIEMPRMDGLSFLAKIMKHHPIPVVIVSSVAPENSDTALRALQLGAIDVIPKPGSQYSIPDVKRCLARSIRAAARANLTALMTETTTDQPAPPAEALAGIDTTHKVLAIGASTGGTRAIESVLATLPPDCPGTVIVQHMPQGFTHSFAQRLNHLCQVEVKEASQGDALVPGRVLIAHGGMHLLVERSGARLKVEVRDGPPVHRHRPSVDVLFRSVARNCGRNAVGVLLTGMGEDGASGLLEMREHGGHTIAQDEASSVVFGMPKVAIDIGAAIEVRPLSDITGAILSSFAPGARRVEEMAVAGGGVQT